jgi:hypothetical protein
VLTVGVDLMHRRIMDLLGLTVAVNMKQQEDFSRSRNSNSRIRFWWKFTRRFSCNRRI